MIDKLQNVTTEDFLTPDLAKEHPIVFSTPLIPGLLDGSKTQTRRTRGLEEINKSPDDWWEPKADGRGWWLFESKRSHPQVFLNCPYGQAGDRLWVREAWASIKLHDGTPPRDVKPIHGIWYKQKEDTRLGPKELNPWPDGNIGKWRSPLFLPRWASRILLEITGVRVERLQEIAEADIDAEGISVPFENWMAPFSPDVPRSSQAHYKRKRERFQKLWDSLNAKKYPWSMNPWVGVLGFRRVA